jgi:hypothetical protein
MAVGRRDGRAGQDVLRRVGEASVLILISLADGPKHGYALIQDIKWCWCGGTTTTPTSAGSDPGWSGPSRNDL